MTPHPRLLHRRSVVQGVAAALAGTSLHVSSFAAASAPAGAPESLEQQLAMFALAMRYEQMPVEVIDAIKRVVLDTLACALAAVGSDAAAIALKTVDTAFGGPRNATVIGDKRATSVDAATFVNGVLVRSLDLNDTYLGTEPLHPSELMPTALALCESLGRNGRDFITALAFGYEASARITDVVSFMRRGFHPLCAMAYAAPLIAGRLWGLGPKELANAVGLSAARGFTSFVVNSGAISMMKAMGFSAGAVDALLVTRLAANGFTGPSGTLEWFAARANPAQTVATVDLDLGSYRLSKVAFKRFPIQIELAAVAEAGSKLSASVRSRGVAIRAIRVETYPGIIERVADADKFKPQTRGTADHSLPVCLAMALLDGDVTLAQFEQDRWRKPDVMDLVRKTTVTPAAALLAKMPGGRGASVDVEFEDGSTLSETVEVPEGDAKRPMSAASLEAKFMNAAKPVLGPKRSAEVMALVSRLETLTDMGQLARALRPA